MLLIGAFIIVKIQIKVKCLVLEIKGLFMYTRTSVCRREEIMIGYVRGELSEIFEDGIIIENNGIGYQISVPVSVLERMPVVGSEVKVYTYLYVKEDILALYGFLTKDDLKIFKLLITVNGIGPKGALGILSTIAPDDLRFAVLAGDEKTIAKAPGIGKKTAQKLIIELKDKLSLEEAFESKLAGNTSATDLSGGFDSSGEAVMALTALGYSQAEALKAVKLSGATADMSSDEILKLALKKMI